MKLTQLRKGNEITLGILTDEGIIDVSEEAERKGVNAPSSMMEVIKEGEDGLKVLEQISEGASCYSKLPIAEAITDPGKVLCIGLNYRRHANECKLPLPEAPVLFNKFRNAIAADNDEVVLQSRYLQYDYEAELVVIIGKTCRNVKKDNALEYVFGYTCGNDLSTRDLQFVRSNQWVLSKTFDKFAPIGPCVVTSDSINPNSLHIWSKVNGQIRQDSNTSDLIFTVAEIIEDLSSHFTLDPGDIIFTGTPEGVIHGCPKEKQEWLKPGDSMEVGIDGIGVLRTRFIEERL